MTVAHAVSNLFSRRAQFIVIGLTGRTGSGCTTASSLLSKDLTSLPLEQVASPLTTPEQRKFRIVRDYAQQNWHPFKVISVTQAIATFIFDQDPSTTEPFFRTFIRNPAALKLYLEETERMRAAWAQVAAPVLDPTQKPTASADADFIRLWEGECKNFLGVTRKVLGNAFSHVFQTMGDNLRLSGKIDSNASQLGSFFALPERVSQIIVCTRRSEMHHSRPARIAIDALRNPFEIQYYRDRFASFYLVAVTTPDKDRKSRLNLKSELNVKEINKIDEKEYPSENKPLSGYAQFVSQNIQACIAKADIFVHNPGEASETQAADLKPLSKQLLTFVSLMQHPGLVTPTKVERCMQIAYSAKSNSGCISRQVGAAIADKHFSIKAVGWNDVPAGQVPCLLRRADDLVAGSDDAAYSNYELHDPKFKSRIEGRYKQYRMVDAGGLSSSFCFKSEYNALDPKRQGNQVHTRSLHAEENAFLQISKYGGVGIDGGILFSTASPCELCSKKAFQLGIQEVFYIDPYPGISMDHILASGPAGKRPKVTLFQGAVGQAFHRLYDPLLPYKDELEVFLQKVGTSTIRVEEVEKAAKPEQDSFIDDPRA